MNNFNRFILLFLLALNCNESEGDKESGMLFTRHPQPISAPLGDEVFFECSLNPPAEKFSWRHRPLNSNKWLPITDSAKTSGKPLKIALNDSSPSNESINVGGKTSKLFVNFDTESKAGDYRCIGYYGTSGLASNFGRLTLAKLDKFSDKNNVKIRVPIGNTVPINCPVPYSSPEAVVQFFKNKKPIEDVIPVGGKTMIIENVKLTDSGSYHCQANNYITNDLYESNYKTILEVYKEDKVIKPYFVKQPQTEYKVLKDSNVTLECFGAGYPIPKVTWSRLAGNLPYNSKITNKGLNIVNVQPVDRGEYDCMWTTEQYKIKSSIILNVVEVPKVVKGPKSIISSEGGDLELSCNVNGTPEPSIEWLINGEPLHSNSTIEIKGTTLFISPVEKFYAGIVQCIAVNEYGSHSGHNFLQIYVKQNVTGSEMNMYETHKIGSSGHGSGPGSHHGGGGGGGGGGHHKRRKNNGKKKIKEGRRRGLHSSASPDLIPPDRPNVTRLSDVSVMVRWSVPENTGLPIQFFKVQYREFGNGKQLKWMTSNTEIPNHVRSFEVIDLVPDHSYQFRIAAVYSNDDNKLSRKSQKFHLTRSNDFETNKMPIPLLINTEAIDSDKILLIWQNPDRDIDIDGYYINYRASTSAGDYFKTTVEGKNSTNITISHLQADTMYEFKIQSFSVDAASKFSKIVKQKTLKSKSESPPIEILSDNTPKSTTDNPTNVNTYTIIGGALGGATLLALFGVILIVYKKNKIKMTRETTENQGKAMANGRVLNGGVADSKINITSNPLAVLDTVDSTIQPKTGQLEMTSFVNVQKNSINNNNNNINSSSATNTIGSHDEDDDDDDDDDDEDNEDDEDDEKEETDGSPGP